MVKIKFKKRVVPKKRTSTVNFLGRPMTKRKPMPRVKGYSKLRFADSIAVPRPTSVSLFSPSMNRPAKRFYGDADRDGVMNAFDCYPRNKFKQGPQHKTTRQKEKAFAKKYGPDPYAGITDPEVIAAGDEELSYYNYSPNELKELEARAKKWKEFKGIKEKESAWASSKKIYSGFDSDGEQLPDIKDPSTWPDMDGPMDYDFEEDEKLSAKDLKKKHDAYNQETWKQYADEEREEQKKKKN